MIRKITILSLLCFLHITVTFAQYFDVPVTGYNTDEVANGIGLPGTTTTGDVDGGTYVFIDGTYQYNSTCALPTAGIMPANNQLASLTSVGLTYVLQSYTGNNALRLPAAVSGTGVGTGTGTLTVTTPVTAGTLYLLAVAGGGAISSGITVTVNFTDGVNPQVFTNLSLVDWCSGTSPSSGQMNRIQISSTSGCSTGSSCQYLYEIPLNLSVSNYTRTIASITIAKTTSTNVLNVFAVGRKVPCAFPTAQPTALVPTAGSSQVSGTFTAATGTPSNYLVVRYPQGSAVTDPVSGTTYTVGQSLGLGTVVSVNTTTNFTATGLIPSTAYTFYVYSYNAGTCSGPLYLTTAPLTANVTTAACGTLSGTVPVGPGLPNTPAGGFTSLTNAINYINGAGLGGNTVLALQSGYDGTATNETFPITFPVNPCIGSTKTLTIRPATGVTGLSISNSSAAAPVIDFNGATYVTIDGVNNGLTISNTSTAATANTSTIRFINDATKNSVVNCTVLGAATVPLSTNGGTIYLATGVTTGNDSITISNCKIGPVGTNLPSKGIYSQGSTASAGIANSDVTISNNEIYDYFLTGGSAGIYALTGSNVWTMSGNKFYQTAARTFSASGTLYGIYFSNSTYGTKVQILNNTIGYSSNTASGTLTLNGTVAGAFLGIYLSMQTSDTNTCRINNNTISDIALTSSSGTFYGIQNGSGAGSNTININNNTIQNIATTTTTGSIYGIAWTSATNMVITGNLINNISRTGAGTYYGIYSGSSSVNETISNNTVSNLTSTSSSSVTIYGIYQNTASGTKLFQNNKVTNITGAGGSTIYGIRVGYGTTIDLSNNQVSNLNATGGTSGGAVYGLYTGTVGTTYNVYKNKVYNLSTSSTAGVIYGLYNSTSTINAYNNIFGDLSSTAYTSSTAPYLGVIGMYISSGNANLYNNTVYIGSVTSTGTNFSTAGFYNSTTPNILLQNNLVVNLATPKGSGKAVGLYRSTTTLSSFTTTSNNNSFYCGTPSSSKAIFWDGTNVYQALADYTTAVTPREQLAVSVNPTFVSTVGSDLTYLHIPTAATSPLESGGTTVALFNTDFDGDARPGPAGSVNGGALNYDIGADEFDGITSFTCTTPVPGNTISSANGICNGTSVTLSLQNTSVGTGISYKWYSSTDGVTYNVIAGATSPTYTTVPTASTYYRCTVTCGSALSGTSTPVQVSFASNVTSTTPGSRCGTGTVALGATGSSGVLNWYSNVSGGAALGSGTSFTTPSISATTSFYVGAETTSAGSVTLGTGTGVNSASTSVAAAYPSWFGNGRQQYLILASELSALGLSAGNITSISFTVTGTGNPATLNGYSIKMAPTTATTITTFQAPTFTNVWGPTNYTPAVGVNTHTFTTPFPWDGASNVLVDICFSNAVTGSGSATTYQTNSGFNSSVCYYADGTGGSGACTTTTASESSQLRPNMTFAGTIVCSSPRVAVVATVSAAPTLSVTPTQTICNNEIKQLSVTSTLSSYNNYVWSPVTDLYTNAAATTPYVAGANASSVYLKSTTPAAAVYTLNANNTTSLCSQVTKDTITILPGSVTATASPSFACMTGFGSVVLTPATGYGAATFQWQNSTNNTTFADISGANAVSYNTPTITSTTYYRANIKNSAGVSCLNSSSDTIRIYSPLVSATTPASRCGPGTLSLGATGVDGTLNWFSAATGGTSIATGSTYTTPSLTATTTYYVEAQSYNAVTGTVGAGGTTMSGSGQSPFAQFWEGARTQYLITPAMLNAGGIFAGSLTSLSFNVSTKSSTLPYTSYSIGLASTTTNSLTAIQTPTFTSVYGPASYSSVLGANTFVFATPYAWDGVSNLLVDICFSNDPGSTGTFWSSNDEVTATTTSYNATYGMYADNSALCGATSGGTTTSSTSLPVIVFTEAGCVSPRVPVTATVNTVPTAGVTPTGPIAFCAGNTTTLTGTGGGTYQWRNASGNIAGATTNTYTASTTGNYKVVVTSTAGCVDSSVAVAVTVNALPVVNLGNDTTFCSGSSLILNAGTSGNAYLWDNATTNQTRVVTTSGTYYVRVTNSSNCIKRDTIVVTVNPTPVVNLGIDTFVCLGTSYTMNAGNAGSAYLWDNASTLQTRTVNASGTYYVRVTNSFNCIGRDTAVVTYLTSPIVNLGADISACVGDVVTLNANNLGSSFLWDNNTTQQTRNVTSSGSYHVVVTNAANCKGYDTVNVTFHALPVVNLGNDTTICHGETLVLNAGNAGNTYLWNDNSTAQTLTVSATGNYNVHVTNSFQCVGTDDINVTVKPLPSGNINAIHGDTATYTFNVLNAQYVTAYTWDFGDSSPLVTGSLVQHRYTANGTYLVSVKLMGECSDSIVSSRTVEVYDVPGSTGVNQVNNTKNLALYPNPTKGMVIIENLGNLDLEHISVYNIIGQRVYDAKADNKMKHVIETAGFVSGMYTARIITSSGEVVRKFEVVK